MSDYFYLIVDDNRIDQLVARQLLTNKGVSDIYAVNSGLEAIEWLKSNAIKLNQSLVILLDIKMPEMDGFAFLDAYENLEEQLKQLTKIFMVSSTLDSYDIERAIQHKYVKQLLSKPLPIDQLFEHLVAR